MKFWQRLSLWQKVFSFFSLHAVLLSVFVFFRYIAADEGLYLSAAREVAVGHLPYFDFAYVHPPYFLFFLSPFAGWGWESLFVCRIISSLASLFIGFVLFLIARRLWDERASFLLWSFWILNGLLLAWDSVVKPAAWADFFVLLGLFMLLQKRSRAGFFFSGIWCGMGLNLRAFMLAPAAVIFLYILLREDKPRAPKLLLWCGGLLAASSFTLYFFQKDPSGFIFNNVTYHYLWGIGVIGARGGFGFLDRLASLAKFVVFPQNLALLLLALPAVMQFSRLPDPRRRNILHLVTGLFTVLGAAFFATTPSPLAYYVQTVPYLVLLAGFGLEYLRSPEFSRFAKLGRLGIGFAHILSLTLVISIFLFGQRQRDRIFLPSNIHPIINYLQQKGVPADTVLSEWVGYAVFAGMQVPKGAETVGLDIAHLLSDEEKRKYHILDSAGVAELLNFKRVRWVVSWGGIEETQSTLLYQNYGLAFDVGPTRVYRRNE